MSDNNMEAFSTYPDYRCLEEGEIRLLKIESPTTLTLEYVQLAKNPEYRAISYEWGDENHIDFIHLDKRQIKLRRNVCALLRRLFDKYGTIRVWLDSICINQQDLEEQAKQVKLMGQIYSAATLVHAWLGEATAETDLIFDALQSFHVQKQATTLAPQLDEAERLSHWREQFRTVYHGLAGRLPESSVEDDPALHEEFNWLLPLFSNTYWQRVWIVQELVLARSIEVFCGDRFIDFNDIYGLSSDWGSFEQSFSLQNHQRSKSKGWHTIQAIRGHRHRNVCVCPDGTINTVRKANVRIDEAIEIYASNHRCSKERDKVYGLRALVPEWSDLSVDYKKPTLEVFLDVAKLRVSRTTGWSACTALKLSRSMGLLYSETAAAIRTIEYVELEASERSQLECIGELQYEGFG